MPCNKLGLLLRCGLLAAVAAAFGLATSLGGRSEAQEQIDISGDWNISFVAFESSDLGSCMAGIQQSGLDLFAAMSCTGDTSGILRGSIEPATGHIALSGMLSGLPAELDGIASADGNAVDGDWSTDTPLQGTFAAIREDRSPNLIDVTGTWNLVLEPLEMEPIESGFSDTCVATIEQLLDEVAATIDCDALGMATLTGLVNPYTRRLNFASPPESSAGGFLGTAAPGGGFILGVWSNHTRDLSSGFRALRTSGPAGDVNCDAAVNTIDAALVLQFDSRLIDTLACPEFADLNASQDVNSIDAALILQRSAGFLALLF